MKIVVGDALSVKRGIIVHGCNCQGVMGSGIARGVRERFPAAYQEYKDQQARVGLILGEICFVKITDELWIVNAMTQDNFGTDSRKVNYEAVAQCFEKVQQLADALRMTGYDLPIIFPKIGAGLGGGNWNIIQVIIDETLGNREKFLYVLTEEEIPSQLSFL
jgi:O-acetyl-ADP-ribose deacetylase (regulator of RNase III)